ncbi:MAG: RNA polymerase sigma factor [Candidatus Limnocylindria bacterium]
MRQDLVSRAQRGEEAAFAELAAAVADRLFSIAYRILRDVDAANDATQETLVTIWRELPALRDADRFEAWSYRIVVNACYAESRRTRRAQPVTLAMPVNLHDDLEGAVVDRDQLERGFRRLPPEQRAALVLQHYLDLSLPQISEVMGIPIGTVRSRLHYARDAMRAALEADMRPVAREGKLA